MPKYTNPTDKYLGNDFLKVPPDTTGYESQFIYPNIPNLAYSDEAPYYNPLKFRQSVEYDTIAQGNNIMLDVVTLPDNCINFDTYLLIKATCTELKSNSVTVTFNDVNNTPDLPVANTNVAIINFNRIKRLYFKIITKSKGDICVIVADKYLISNGNISHGANPF